MSKENYLANALEIDHEIEILSPIKSDRQMVEVSPQQQQVKDNPDQKADYDLARKTFRDLIEKGNSAIDNIADLARESESPRAYEVFATMIKTLGEMSTNLLDIQKKNKELNTSDNAKKLDETVVNVDKAVFVGTTADLLKQIKKSREE